MFNSNAEPSEKKKIVCQKKYIRTVEEGNLI